MTYRGRLKGNTIVLDCTPAMPEGTEFVSEPVETENRGVSDAPTLGEMMGDLIGSIHDLPPDYSLQHGRYRRVRQPDDSVLCQHILLHRPIKRCRSGTPVSS